jgi:uncharacterized metal-binding protein/predicted Fe-Mo cluster-binding NifX family protein
MLAQISGDHVVSKKIVETMDMSEEERLSQLVELGIDVFICGAIEQEFIEMANSYGIKIIQDVAAEIEEILSALTGGYLKAGYGFAVKADSGVSPSRRIRLDTGDKLTDKQNNKGLAIDCVDCIDRICLKGESCKNALETSYPVKEYEEYHHSMEVTMDIAAETERKLCRIAEFIYYCLGMEYKHVGIAFCVEMFQEAEILTRLLRRFFKVSPVCCKVGGHTRFDFITSASGVLCNPIGQAWILNNAKTDINVMAGLCVGCDMVFMRHSEAPTSPLFVKDKSLANNPISALYSKYYIDEILSNA